MRRAKTIEVCGQTLTGNEHAGYRAENKAAELDFNILEELGEYRVYIFDSRINDESAFLDSLARDTLEEAVTAAFEWEREGGRACFIPPATEDVGVASDELAQTLRDLSEVLEAAPSAARENVFFPNWHAGQADEREQSIRRACEVIRAEVDEDGDGGREVSKKDLAALLHYVADMLEA